MVQAVAPDPLAVSQPCTLSLRGRDVMVDVRGLSGRR
jgi:hypothetical protein